MADALFYQVTVKAASAAYDLSGDLTSLTIEQREAEPDQLTVTMADPDKVLGHALQEGMDVEVALGTADDHGIVFRGRIYKVDARFPGGGVPTLTVRAFDRSMAMGLVERNRVFSDMTLSAVVKQVASAHFEEVDVDVEGDPGFGKNGFRQQDETDLALIRRLAREFGCVTYATSDDDGDSFHFLSEKTVMTSEPALTLVYDRLDAPDPLVSFESSAEVGKIQLPRVLSGIDGETGDPIDAFTTEAIEPDDDGNAFFDENLAAFRKREPVRAAKLEGLIAAAPSVQKKLRDALGKVERVRAPTFVTRADLHERAKNAFSAGLYGMTAHGSAPGRRKLLACTTVEIGNVGGRFSNTWFLSEVRHVLDGGDYRTEFTCRR
jgi:phage protein D